MNKKLLLKTDIPREKGFLYYCSTSKEGNLTIYSVEMSRKGRKSKPKKKK